MDKYIFGTTAEMDFAVFDGNKRQISLINTNDENESKGNGSPHIRVYGKEWSLPKTVLRNKGADVTPALLMEMAAVDIRDVDPQNLVDIENVCIDQTLTKVERIRDFISQIRNPYCYVSHGTIVKIAFSGKKTLEECLSNCIRLQS